MPNKNLTDNEIKKALECCKNILPNCPECPIKEKERIMCCDLVKEYALDLINRQEEEVENYKQIAEHQQSVTMDRGFEIKRLKEEHDAMHQDVKAAEEYAWKLKEENQNLKAEIQELKIEINMFRGYDEEIKAEAYKEFADKLERAFSKSESQMPNSEVIKQTVQICRNAIRIVVNELVGGSDGDN